MKKLLLVLAVIIPFALQGQVWQRVLEEYVDGVYHAGAYSGSVNYSKPFWVDIDADNDYDLFIAGEHGGMHYYRNDGNASSPSWTFIEEYFNDIDIRNRASEAFVDIDADGDYDLFIGEQDGYINFYRNDGTSSAPYFVLISENYEGIDVGMYSAPFFCDIDDDGDFDMFIGEHAGTINYYRNDGSASSPTWTFVTDTWFGIDVGSKNIPWLVDIDADNDYDLFIGYSEGTTWFYRNDGTPSTPNMVYVTNNYIADVGNTNAPSFVDIDNDGDFDFFVGEYIGNINFYRNIGTPQNASWTFVIRHYLTIDMNSSTTPAMVDIDADGDYDLFSGEWVGFIDYYRNDGTAANHQWTVVSENYDGIDVGDNSTPTFVDIDNDNDYDLFIGNVLGNIYYYRNDGSVNSPNFTFVSSNYNSIDVGDNCAPTFVDIDNDNDFDLFIGNLLSTIWYYRNDGTPNVPSWTYITDNYNGISVGERSTPVFADIDGDNDFDLFIGEALGSIWYYRNDGTPSVPSFTYMTDAFAGINVEENTAPTFVDIDNDADLDLFIGERWGGLNLWQQIPADVTPPEAPYIYGEKISADAYFWWHPVTRDTAGNPETVSYYVIYRNTSPDFVPGPSDSIGVAPAPDTTFTDVGAVNTGNSYYYLVKAVDVATNRSGKSNMGFKFNKFLNENATITDMNWVSLPYHNVYTTVSDISTEMSPTGSSIAQFTRLRADQYYEDWTYIPGFGWFGTDFSMEKGRAYEFVAEKDTTTVFVGSHDPYFAVPLYENPSTTDMNWTSIPYNAVYSSASDITTEYSPSGDPLVQLTRLRDDQFYEDWTYIPGFGWFGTNFSIDRGYGYEYVVNTDATWLPTIYSNRTGGIIAKSGRNEQKLSKKNCYREPAWATDIITDSDFASNNLLHKQQSPFESARRPHLVAASIDLNTAFGAIEELTFTAYCVDHSQKALFEGSVGCGISMKQDKAMIWVEFGNLPDPWSSGEDAIIIAESRTTEKHLFGIIYFSIDGTQNPQYIGDIVFHQMPAVTIEKRTDASRLITWHNPEASLSDIIVGYCVYADGQRLNDNIISHNEFSVGRDSKYEVIPVIIGGYEISFLANRTVTDEMKIRSHHFSFGPALPNPFAKRTHINYALPEQKKVNITIYDVMGRQVRTLLSEVQEPGYYSTVWNGLDNQGKQVSTGIYFVRFEADEFKAKNKVLLVK